ncbi:MAG TPA: serine/threonine-protein kinase, partial [Polyangiaceae bacterium LLY-WYZ-15_(1-7)]|nr:serine/threonine-protein kinase [Polyangiaceae bacterium LLY-WYZ-15_(1-7)]
MSVVWRARQGTRRGPVPCAVKTLRPELAHDPLYVRALRVEGELAQVVRHPHVVRCFGAGEHGGVPYLVLQLVEGVALHAVLRELARRRMRLPVPWVARIGERVARALHAAHTSRAPDGRPMPIVHRDVSPANVMLDTRGKLWLFDFGVAKAVVEGAERSAVFKGRVGYAAPEQLALAQAHPRMDVHGLGVVLHEMLTGRRLFARAELGALRARQEGSVPPPSSFAVGIPAALDALVLACLSVDPAKRPATALEVAHRLGRLVPAVDAPTREEVRVLVEVVSTGAPASRLRALGFTSRSRGPRVALPLAPTPTEPLERVPTRPTARPPVFEPVSGAWAEDTEHEIEGARARAGPRSADETTGGLENAGLENAGLENAGLENAGLEDAGPQNDGAENTGAEKTEPTPRDAKIDAESVGAREIDAGIGGPDMDAKVEANEPGDARRAEERSSPSPLSPVVEVEPPPEPAWLAPFR